MKIHMDLASGIAGDMFLAATLELGLESTELLAALKSIPLPPWEAVITQERRGGIAGTALKFSLPAEHHHRHLPEIAELIHRSALPLPVQERALAIFATLASAEGKVHAIAPERVHFHEVGAVDAILDICGAAYAAWRLEFTTVTATPPPAGSGTVRCQHGVMPLPAPAVAEIIRAYRIPLAPDPVEGETVTPTGAAILANLVTSFGPATLRVIHRVGHGLGGREQPHRPNLLRLLAEEETTESDEELVHETIQVLSTHIDDMNPEWYGRLWEELFAAGALDVALLPLTMKKGRPATRLEVIATPATTPTLARLILTHTTTLGVRIATLERLAWRRVHGVVATPWGELQVVVAGGIPRPEYESLARLAMAQGIGLAEASLRVAPYLVDGEQLHHT